MEKSLQPLAINISIGVLVFMSILNMGRCEDGSSTPLTNQPLSSLNQLPLNAQSYTSLNGQPLVNQLPANSQIGQQFPSLNQPLINQPAGFVNQPFSPLNVQPGLSQQPLLNGASLTNALNQPFTNSFAFSGSDNQRLSAVQVVVMASCWMMFVLSFLFL